jgi:hypothetical protein
VGKRHRRIRARSATGQVAGAATEKPGSKPIAQETACPTCVLPESPRPGRPKLGRPPDDQPSRSSFMPRKATFWRCDRGFRFHPKAEARQDGRATARRVSSRMESAAATPSSSRPHRCGACVPTITVARLRSHLARSPPGPTRPEGGGLDRITLRRCRRTVASLMIAAGVNAKALQTYMGHASISITLRPLRTPDARFGGGARRSTRYVSRGRIETVSHSSARACVCSRWPLGSG